MYDLLCESALALIKLPVHCMRINQNKNVFTFILQLKTTVDKKLLPGVMAMTERVTEGKKLQVNPLALSVVEAPFLSHLSLLHSHPPTYTVFLAAGTNVYI